MARYIAGQIVRVFTSSPPAGLLGPFLNTVTGDPVTPDQVQCKFRIEGLAPVQIGPTSTLIMGTPLDLDEFNPTVTMQQDEDTLGYFFTLNTTLFLSDINALPLMANFRTVWESLDPDNSAVSPSKVDTIWAPDL